LIGLAIAVTAFAPFWASGLMTGFMRRGWFVLRGPALWLWLNACVLVWIPAIWGTPTVEGCRGSTCT
jgi:hypothetical protein